MVKKKIFTFIFVLGTISVFILLTNKGQHLEIIAGILSSMVTLSLFTFIWNAKKHFSTNFLLIIASSFFFSGLVNFLYILSSKGNYILNAEIFCSGSLQLIARYIEGISVVGAYIFLRKKPLKEPCLIFVPYFLVSILAAFSLFTWKLFPAGADFFHSISLNSEVPLMVILLGAGWLHLKNKKYFEPHIFNGLSLFLSLTLLSELLNSFRMHHRLLSPLALYARLCSYYFMYRAILKVKIGLDQYHLFKNMEHLPPEASKKAEKDQQKNNEIKAEMSLAKEVQEEMLPKSLPKIPGVNFCSIYKPVSHVGGDFYDFIHLEPDRTGIFLSDVSGHGIAAAMVTTMLKALIQTSGELCRFPRLTLEFMNKKLLEFSKEIYITAIYAVYHHHSHSITYSRAAHPALVLIRNGKARFIKDKGGFIIGMFDEEAFFDESSFSLETGDKILLYTDGLLDALGEGSTMFSDKLLATLDKKSALPIEEILKELHHDLKLYSKDSNIDDDICILGMEREKI